MNAARITLKKISAALILAVSVISPFCAEAKDALYAGSICLDADAISAKSGKPSKEILKIKSDKIPAWIFDSKGENAVSGTLDKMPEGYRGLKVEIVATPLNAPKSAFTEDVYRATIFQTEKNSTTPINKLKCVPVRSKVPAAPLSLKTIELESCYPAKPGLQKKPYFPTLPITAKFQSGKAWTKTPRCSYGLGLWEKTACTNFTGQKTG